MYQFSYLLADGGMLLIWLVLFIWRKDVRRVMWWLSIIFGLVGVITEYVWTVDWWRPLTITHTRVGIEDFLFGFWIAGIAAVIYEEVFREKVSIRSRQDTPELIFSSVVWIVVVAVLFYGSFYVLGLSSFWSSMVALVPPVIYIWIKRRDLIKDSIITGILVCLAEFLWFVTGEAITPGWVRQYWMLQNLSGIIIWKVPLEDLIWGLVAGAFVGPLYEVWQGAKLVAYRPSKQRIKKYQK